MPSGRAWGKVQRIKAISDTRNDPSPSYCHVRRPPTTPCGSSPCTHSSDFHPPQPCCQQTELHGTWGPAENCISHLPLVQPLPGVTLGQPAALNLQGTWAESARPNPLPFPTVRPQQEPAPRVEPQAPSPSSSTRCAAQGAPWRQKVGERSAEGGAPAAAGRAIGHREEQGAGHPSPGWDKPHCTWDPPISLALPARAVPGPPGPSRGLSASIPQRCLRAQGSCLESHRGAAWSSAPAPGGL